jgi:hypothetical protein
MELKINKVLKARRRFFVTSINLQFIVSVTKSLAPLVSVAWFEVTAEMSHEVNPYLGSNYFPVS